MVKHVILWQLKDELSEVEKVEVKKASRMDWKRLRERFRDYLISR